MQYHTVQGIKHTMDAIKKAAQVVNFFSSEGCEINGYI